jgi:hypothetical protein
VKLFFFLLFLCSCSVQEVPQAWIEIHGRASDKPIYRAKLPPGWTLKILEPSHDSTRALAEFYFKEIRVTFHNFPEQEIPPFAQIARWKRQFSELSSSSTHPQAFSGFVGALFEGEGIIDGHNRSVMGWAMQLAPEHAQYLQTPDSQEAALLYKEMRAAFTLKAVGEQLQEERETLKRFALSFELIDPLPSEL